MPPGNDRRMDLSAAKRALLERRLRGGDAALARGPTIARRPRADRAPLSFAQRQLWVIDQMHPATAAYNLPYAFRVLGPLNVPALEAALNAVVQRHEILRTCVAVEEGEPCQSIHPACHVRIGVTSLESHLPGTRERTMQALATAEAGRPFDLTRLPLLRASLFRLARDEHVFLLNLHHIVADGLSMPILMDELNAYYEAHIARAEPALPVLPVQYGDYALWQQRAHPSDAGMDAGVEYWVERLADLPDAIELPVDLPRPAHRSFAGSNAFFEVPADAARALHALGASEGCTPFMTMLAAYEVLLGRYAGAHDFVVGVPLARRVLPELEPLIGNFLTTAPVRCDLSGAPDFRAVLRRARVATLDALSHGDVPLEMILPRLRVDRTRNRNPIFQVLFERLPTPAPRLGTLDVRNVRFDLPFAQFDLSLHLHEENGGYVGRFEYCTELFRADTVERIAANFGQLMHAAVAEPERSVDTLCVVSAPERRRLLRDWNGEPAAAPATSVHALIAEQVRRTPDRVAVRDASATLTYARLAGRSAAIAAALRARGVSRGDRVGLCVARNGDLVAAMLAVLETGAAYVPLDPSFPGTRLRFMAEDAALSAVVSTRDAAPWCPLPREQTLLLDDDAAAIAAARGAAVVPLDPVKPDDPAYVIYTSGSTGQPKGVVIPHRAVVNLLASMARTPGLTDRDVLLAVTTPAFDIAVLELLLPLTVGATVVIATSEQARDGGALRSLLHRHGATVMQATPVTWRLLLDAGWTGASPFRALVGGEALPRDLAERLLALGVELWNMYGPTETTVWSTCARIERVAGAITIGRPIANTTVRVLTHDMCLCPAGVPGELCIGGAGVALGYWKRPALTAQRFVRDPFDAGGRGVLYRTGDRARWRADGTLEHLGRFDDQIKLRGFRIEAEEVEAAIARVVGVREAAVRAVDDGPDAKRLVAYVVAHPPARDLVARIREAVGALLPDYMRPARYVLVDSLPRTANGKLDRRALTAPPPAPSTVADRAAATARTPTEAAVLCAFRDVLGRGDVAPRDDFFALGGDSINAARLVLRIRAVSGFDVPLGVLFERRTAAGMAEVIDALAAVPPRPTPGAGRLEVEL